MALLICWSPFWDHRLLTLTHCHVAICSIDDLYLDCSVYCILSLARPISSIKYHCDCGSSSSSHSRICRCGLFVVVIVVVVVVVMVDVVVGCSCSWFLCQWQEDDGQGRGATKTLEEVAVNLVGKRGCFDVGELCRLHMAAPCSKPLDLGLFSPKISQIKPYADAFPLIFMLKLLFGANEPVNSIVELLQAAGRLGKLSSSKGPTGQKLGWPWELQKRARHEILMKSIEII